jgi:GTPase Era involved in 16S rRNA processing
MVPIHLKKRFKLTRSHILDPRSSLWEADVICVVQDCSDKYRRHKIDTEVLKCLYMHPEKESILILNKIDLVRQKKYLFDLIAHLTDGQLNGNKFDIKDTRPISLEKQLETIYLSTAKKLNLKLPSIAEEKDIIKLLEELKECENILFNNEDYLSSFDKEVDSLDNTDDVVRDKDVSIIGGMSLEKLTNENDITPYKSVDDITAHEFKDDLKKTTDWHLYYEKLNRLELLVRERKSWPNFNQVFLISAKTNDGVADLKRYLFSRAQPGNWLFSRSLVTDQMPKDIAMMCVREKMLEHLPEEVPYEMDIVSCFFKVVEKFYCFFFVFKGCSILEC